MKSIYILLTRTRTVLSRMIHATTGDGFTHVSIALDRDLTELFSFARKHSMTPLPAGLVHENLHTAVYARNGRSQCKLLRVQVTEQQFDVVKSRIDTMLASKDDYHYSILGLLLCKLDLAHERHHHMFCSQFVASLLADAGIATLPKPASLMHPVDFVDVPGLECCYEGPLGASNTWWLGREQAPLYKGRLAHVYSISR